MPKVFVTQAVRSLNFSSAEEYGEVVFLSDLEYRPEPSPPRFNDETTAQIKRGMADYLQGTDFICTTGSSLPNVIVGSMLNKGAHKILKWNNRSNRYELFTIRI